LSNLLNHLGHHSGSRNSFANADQKFGVGGGCLMDFPHPNYLACQHCLP
jgi:hypothetical protein